MSVQKKNFRQHVHLTKCFRQSTVEAGQFLRFFDKINVKKLLKIYNILYITILISREQFASISSYYNC